jgi:hypothetical protein
VIIGAIFGLLLGGELLLPVLEEIGMLLFEWVEKTMDIFFEEAFEMAPAAAQKATAWTGLLLILGLLGWGGYSLHQRYLRMKAAAPQWWAEQMRAWNGLPWRAKLSYIALAAALLSILALFI